RVSRPARPGAEEGARPVPPAELSFRGEPAVLAGEWHPLGHALVDDVDADFREPVDVGLAGPIIATLDRVVEEPLDAIAVVLVVLGRVDPALGGDRVGPAGGALVAEGVG